ncbi:MAG: hypothetical protein QM808_04400 [Steroidobacteraceae bacterium]
MSFVKSIRACLTLPAAVGVLHAASSAAADSPLTAYYGNTLLCQNQSSKAICHIWLNQDGSYFLMYDRGVQADVPTGAKGNYRIEGRRGTYELKGAAGAYQVCLQPNAVDGKQFAIETAGEIYAGKSCYVLPEKQVGDSWMQSSGSQQYKMWLVKGHG